MLPSREYINESEEEEEMVRRVGGRGEAILRLRRESREGPSKFRREPQLYRTSSTGGRSTWSGSGEETRRASGKGEKK